MSVLTAELENAIVQLVSNVLLERGVRLDDEYHKVEFNIYGEDIVKNILKAGKFKDIGSVFDYPEYLPQPDVIDGRDLSSNFKMFYRIATSKKFNSIVFYSSGSYQITCSFMIDPAYLEEFSKITRRVLQMDYRANLFRGIDFKCKKGEFIEVSEATGEGYKPADVSKRTISNEKLVFDQNSTIVEVMKDIYTFFQEDTKKMYEKMDIAYKRGIILYGDPGNGKSAMIREIVRNIPRITKIIINPNIDNVTRVLNNLVRSLDDRQAIVVIEDIDSLITERNRSEFLNILDGVEVKSGLFFIGTTNYPDRIDPAFMNRSGRFDRMYKIDNPTEETRRLFFQSRGIAEVLSEYKVSNNKKISNDENAIVELFVKHSHDLPMANLKELMTSTKYTLANNPDLTIEEAVQRSYNILIGNKQEHIKAHKEYNKRKTVQPTAIELVQPSV